MRNSLPSSAGLLLPRFSGVLLLAGLVVMGTHCGSGSGSSPSPGGGGPPPPVIAIDFLSPIVARQNAPSFTLTVNGSGFSSNSQVVFNGNAKPTTLISSTQLTATIAPADVSSAGTFNVQVQDSGVASNDISFYVVPVTTPQVVAVSPGFPPAQQITINMPAFNPPKLQVKAVGVGNSAGGTPVQLAPGHTYSLLIVGDGIAAGTYYSVSGNAGDVTVTQPVVSNFSQTTTGTPAVNVNITISATAVTGARSLLVTNPAGEISVFVGGLVIGSGT